MNTHESTVQARSREGSASGASRPDTARSSASTPLQSASASPGLDKAPAPAATPATPATPGSGRDSPAAGLSSREQALRSAAEAVVEDVFSAVGEILSAPESPHKEFHCAVLRALSKESTAAAEPPQVDRAPGTAGEAGALPLKKPIQASRFPPPTPLRLSPGHSIALLWESWDSAVVFLFFFSFFCFFFSYQHPPYPQSTSSTPLLDYFLLLPTPPSPSLSLSL